MTVIQLSRLQSFASVALLAVGLASAQTAAPNAAAVQKQIDALNRNGQLQELMNHGAAIGQARAQAQAQAQAQASRVAPAATPPDPARLARVNRDVPSPDALRQHVAALHAALLQRLPAGQRQGTLQLIAALKGQHGEPSRTASQAWLMGLPELGLLLMAQACVDDPADVDARNNLAAFLTMLGGEPQAMPLLLRLAADYPANATVQNNLGQAWYGLGDTAEAEKHLKAAVRIFAAHAQANQTLADMAQARGDRGAAVAALKLSLQAGYSREKATQLERLGAPPDLRALPLHVPHAPDPLGLEHFTLPPYCKGIDDAGACSARWARFQAEVEDRQRALRARLEKQKQAVRQQLTPTLRIDPKATLVEQMQAAQELVARKGLDHPPPLGAVMQPRLQEALDNVGRLSAALENETGPLRAQYRSAKAGFDARAAAIDKRYTRWGEGQPAGYEAQYCAEINPVLDEASRSLNALLERISAAGRSPVIRAYNDHAFYAQYVYDDTDFQALKTQIQLQFLGWLGSQRAEPIEGRMCKTGKTTASGTQLQDFYDLHCDSLVKFDSVVFGSFEIRCNKMTSRLNLSFPVAGVKVGISGTMVENLDSGQFIRSTAEIGASTGAKATVGPVEAGIGVSGGGFIEMDGNGITDVGLKGGASAGAGPLGASVSGRIGWNAGGSGSGKGSLAGFTVAGH